MKSVFLVLPMGTWNIISFGCFYQEYIVETACGKNIFSLVLKLVLSQYSSQANNFLIVLTVLKIWILILLFYFYLSSRVFFSDNCLFKFNNLRKQPIFKTNFWIDFLTWRGIKWDTLNYCLHFNRDSFINKTSDCLKYLSSMTS